MQDHPRSDVTTGTVLSGAVTIGLLLALRLPALAQPAGADQSLYAYVGQQMLAGGAPYVDAWDQKPPGIHALYAVLWALWPHDAVIAAADLGAAVLICLCLVLLGRRFSVPGGGWLAAGVFALLANPSLQRLSGVFVRGQCETFIAAAVAMGLVLAARPTRSAWPRLAAGVCLGLAIWLKYNAAVYLVPIIAAVWFSRSDAPGDSRRAVRQDLAWILAGVVAMGALGLTYLALHGALTDLKLATFDYNLEYSGETYASPLGAVAYVLQLPLARARYDLLWYLGGVGLLAALLRREARVGGGLALAWTAASIASIAINGARDLPQYFVQAAPAFAYAAGVGLTSAWRSRRAGIRLVTVALVILGLWRVGSDEPLPGGIRLGSLPGLAANIRFDLDYLGGRVDRAAYLARFGGERDADKFAAADVDELAGYVRLTTRDDETILVFGFSPGVYVQTGRTSASRFFWSRPVVVEFAADEPGYGPAGLLADLDSAPPALIALQKRDWVTPDSETYFLAHPDLSSWLARHYRREGDLRLYSLWRRIE